MTPLPPLAMAVLLQLPTGSNPFVGQMFMFAAIFAIFYFILIRPQQRARREHEASLQTLKKGDRVVTAGGIIGDVVHIKALGADGKSTAEDEVTIRSGESRLIVERGRIARIVTGASSASNSAA